MIKKNSYCNALTRWILHLVIFVLIMPGGDMAALAAPRSKANKNAGRALIREQPTGKRVALVIGNSDYHDPRDSLPNPTNDASDITIALRKFGFEVIIGKNLTLKQMRSSIAAFGRKANNADVALFYYAGHGIQNKSQNYLMPVDAEVESIAQAVEQGINVNYLLDELDNAKSKVNIVMLDACRNNTFNGQFRSLGGTGVERGLAPVNYMPEGTVVVYATAPGKTAADGTRRNGLFTEGLLNGFEGEDRSLDGVLTVASEYVEEQSQGRQSPHVNGPKTVQKRFYFAKPTDKKSPKVATVVQPEPVVEIPASPPAPLATMPRILPSSTNRALLIGIGSYNDFPLEGPPYDVIALKQILPQWGFKPQEIIVVQDQQATRNGILDALKALAERSQNGDKIFFFYSGHGTSTADQKFGAMLPIPGGLGTLVPVDFSVDTPETMAKKLVKESEDIRPLLEIMDRKGVQVLAVFDTDYFCTNSYTGQGTINLNIEPSYHNVVYWSGSTGTQHNIDITSKYLKKSGTGTIDGNPHGAFTNALLQVLHGEIQADTNSDGMLSPAELNTSVESLISEKFRQTPCILPKPNADSNNITARGFFEKSRTD